MKYRYSGPTSGVTLQKGEEAQEVMLHTGAEVELPAPNPVDSRFVLECLTTDSEGDGILFAALLGNKLLYAASTGSWYLWAGHRWFTAAQAA